MNAPKLSQRSIHAIQKALTGDPIDKDRPAIAPYLSGPNLVGFFHDFGFNDDYPNKGGFPSRWAYVESRLQARNGTDAIARIVEAAVHPQRFLDTQFRPDDAVAHINKYLAYDGFELVSANKAFRLRRSGEPVVEMEATLVAQSKSTHEFIEEQ